MPPDDTNDPQHWRDRAAQMRSLAATIGGSEAAILMNDLAADYDKLAERAEIRTKGKKPRSNGKPR
jgi:protein subunit release factor A